jgi:hypothetical protein
MPSNSLLRWRSESADALDEIEHAHASVGGTRRGRRYATQQIDWRNAIAHQDFATVAPAGPPTLRLSSVRAWRRALNALADNFDRVMYNYLRALPGGPPW